VQESEVESGDELETSEVWRLEALAGGLETSKALEYEPGMEGGRFLNFFLASYGGEAEARDWDGEEKLVVLGDGEGLEEGVGEELVELGEFLRRTDHLETYKRMAGKVETKAPEEETKAPEETKPQNEIEVSKEMEMEVLEGTKTQEEPKTPEEETTRGRGSVLGRLAKEARQKAKLTRGGRLEATDINAGIDALIKQAEESDTDRSKASEAPSDPDAMETLEACLAADASGSCGGGVDEEKGETTSHSPIIEVVEVGAAPLPVPPGALGHPRVPGAGPTGAAGPGAGAGLTRSWVPGGRKAHNPLLSLKLAGTFGRSITVSGTAGKCASPPAQDGATGRWPAKAGMEEAEPETEAVQPEPEESPSFLQRLVSFFL
jgi:hypothetical protein